jgi:gamma-glutamyl:cysteine ligase YbdK (ATP-grasp superfamily)
VIRPSAGEDRLEGRILDEPKATRAVLQFLADTQVALHSDYLQQTAERARRDDERGLETLEEAEQRGEG